MKLHWNVLYSIIGAVIVLASTVIAAISDVETAGFVLGHSSPTAIGSYRLNASVTFADNASSFTAKRKTPYGNPDDTITVYLRDGWNKSGVDHTINQTSKSHTWSGADVTDWTDSASVSGSTTFGTSGSYGYWGEITRTINGGSEAMWVSSVSGASAQVTGGFTILPF
jgi:hypothetical protein